MTMRKVGEKTLLKIIYMINNRLYKEKGEEEAVQMKKEVERADDDEKGRRKGIKNKSKCSKILNTFLYLFSNKMLVIRAEIHKKLGKITNREDHAQTRSSLGRQLVFKNLEHIESDHVV